MEKLARRDLSPTRMYRIDRHDAMGDIPLDCGIQERLRWCGEHLLRVNTREGTFPLSAGGLRMAGSRDIAEQDSGISFGENWFTPEFDGQTPFRWVNTRATLHLRAPKEAGRTELAIDLEPGAGTGYGPFLLVAVNETGATVAERCVNGRQVVNIPAELAPDRRSS
jgi:hypothetical protein